MLTKLKTLLKNLFVKYKLIFGLVGSVILLLVIAIAGYKLYFLGKIYPGISVASINLNGKTQKEAFEILSEEALPPEKLTILSDNQSFDIELSTIDFSYDITKSVDRAYYLYRTGNLIYDLMGSFNSNFANKNLGLISVLSEEKLNDNLSVIAGQVAIEPISPSVSLVQNEIVIDKGTAGKEIDMTKLREDFGVKLSYLDFSPLTINTKPVGFTLTQTQASRMQERAGKLLDKQLTLTFEYQSFTYEDDDIFKTLTSEGYDKQEIERIIADIVNKVDREPQNAVFNFDQGLVKEFIPAKDGVIVNKGELADIILNALKELETSDSQSRSVAVPVKNISPSITTENVNNLGIKELIGRGSSTFRGSISSRVHNVGLASSKFNGVLVEPNQTVSFNATVGDVSSLTGYKQAYVIKDGQTVLGDGGGVCQVSTTLFRAILDAGLPVVERRAHSYRVGYYEQDSPPGMDATVYAPTTDLKFTNDTPAHVLIQTQFDSKNSTLVFEIYGTSDGRIAKTTKPVITSVSPPPEDLYIDDPNLPIGQVKQIDYKAWGARVVFDYEVERNGEIIFEKTFYSNFKPWQAKFLRGTSPAQ